jgi:acyl-CoA dehydrogenase
MADALAELYLLSTILKRFDDDGRPADDLAVVNYCARNCLHRFDLALRGTIDNFPVRWAAWLMGPLVLPFGVRRPASDNEGKTIVRQALQPGAFRDRLTRDIFSSDDIDETVGLLEQTLLKSVACEAAEKKLERAIRKGDVKRFHDNDWIADAKTKGVLSAEEACSLAELRDMVARVIAVDDFSPEELARETPKPTPKPSGKKSPRRKKPQHIAAE